MSVAARTAERVQARANLGAVHALAVLVTASFALRAVLGFFRATPTFLPDEYIYSEIARSLAESGKPLVRGASAHFPALLQPILTAPAWLVNDVEVSFRLVHLMGALAMSLAAVPVYLLARRLGLGSGLALASAGLALAVPDTVYAYFILSEPFAYPLALGAVWLGVEALARPRRRTQVAFVALAGLAAFARLQFAVLPVCFAAGVLIVGLRERALRRVLREQALTLSPLVLGLVALLVAGPRRAFGYYEGVLDFDLLSAELARWGGLDAMVLAYVSGWALAPGALIGLWLALRRPRSRGELAFGALAVPVVLALVLQAAAYGIDGDRVQERYFFYAVPLVGLAFALYASRGLSHRLVHALLAVGLLVLSLRAPLSGLAAAEGKTNSPLLYATSWLETRLDDVGLASLVFALGFGAVTIGLLAALWRGGRAFAPVTFGLALASCLLVFAGAAAYEQGTAASGRASVFAANPSFVDASGLEGAALLQSPHGGRTFALGHLFWNRSVDDVLLLPHTGKVDGFGQKTVTFGRDGSLLVDGRPVTGPLLVDAYGATLRFRGTQQVAASPPYRLLRPVGRPRLALYASGRYYDGWLATAGSIRLWPASPGNGLAGRLSFRLLGPKDAPVTLALGERQIRLAPGASKPVELAVCSSGPWSVDFSAPPGANIGGRFVSAGSTEPVFRPDPAACP